MQCSDLRSYFCYHFSVSGLHFVQIDSLHTPYLSYQTLSSLMPQPLPYPTASIFATLVFRFYPCKSSLISYLILCWGKKNSLMHYNSYNNSCLLLCTYCVPYFTYISMLNPHSHPSSDDHSYFADTVTETQKDYKLAQGHTAIKG